MNKLFDTYIRLVNEVPDINTHESEAVRLDYPEDADNFQAADIILNSLYPWEDANVFNKICIIHNNRELIPDMAQELSPHEVVHTAHDLKVNFPNRQFNDEVCRYIASIFEDNGTVTPHPLIPYIAPYLPVLPLTSEQLDKQRDDINRIDTYIKNVHI